MSERIQVKRDGEHRGWVSYVGVNVVTKPGDGEFDVIDVWSSTRTLPFTEQLQIFPSRDAAIRWLVEEETA